MYTTKITYSPNKPINTIKLCKDCKFYKPILFRNIGTCELCGDVDIANGDIFPLLADKSRSMICGEEGKFFEKKQHYKLPDLFLRADFDMTMGILSPIFWVLFIFVLAAKISK